MKKVLITGANGFLGHGLVPSFEGKYSLRLMDVTSFTSTKHEVVVGDVADLPTVQKAMNGMDALVIAHMGSRTHDRTAYQEPPRPFDGNVKGTANLFFAAQAAGIKRVVMMSSVGVVSGYQGVPFLKHDQPPYSVNDIYTLTKVCQEVIALHYHRTYKMEIAALRLGGIMDADTMQDKYGKVIKLFGPTMIDRRDIGEAARLALEMPGLTYETFYVMGPPEAHEHYDMEYTKKRLGWQPKYEFKEVSREK
jgi:nucleoside-diphosphate-sugar epimerase